MSTTTTTSRSTTTPSISSSSSSITTISNDTYDKILETNILLNNKQQPPQQIIKHQIFKSFESSQSIINSIDELIKSPNTQYCDELIYGKSLITIDKIKFDEKIDTIKKNAIKDFTIMNNDNNNNNSSQPPILINVLNLYIQLKIMIEFNNQFQRKFLKDLFQQQQQDNSGASTSNASPNKSNNNNNFKELQKILNELSSYHNLAPLSFIDMITKDYSSRYLKMFNNFTYKDNKNNNTNSIIINVPVFKLANGEDIGQAILSIYFDIQKLTKHLPFHHSNQPQSQQHINNNNQPKPTHIPTPTPINTPLQINNNCTMASIIASSIAAANNNNNNNNNNTLSPTTTTNTTTTLETSLINNLILTIFKSIDINKILITIDNLIKSYTQYKQCLNVIKELMSSKDGQKGINVKIETIKRNALKLIMDETILKDRKSVLESDLYSKYLELRLIVEFNFMYQRKLLKEHPIHKLQSPFDQSKRMNDLSIFHNSFPLYIYDLAKRDFSRYNKIANIFNFIIDSKSYTIPLFKLALDNGTVIDQFDISDVIQLLFNQVYQLVQKYKQTRIKLSPPSPSPQQPSSSTTTTTSTQLLNKTTTTTSTTSTTTTTTTVIAVDEQQPPKSTTINYISDFVNSNSVSQINNSTTTTTTNTTTTALKDDQVIMNILKTIFDYNNFDKDLFYDCVMSMKRIYQRYSGSLLTIRESIVNNKKNYNEFLDTITLLKKNVKFEMDKNIIINSNSNNNNNNEQIKLLFNECLSKIFSYRALICFNFFYQKIQLKERLETIIGNSSSTSSSSSSSSSTSSSSSPELLLLSTIEITRKLNEIHSQIIKDLFQFESIQKGVLNESILNNDLIFDINDPNLSDGNGKKIITIRVFKFGGDSIIKYVCSLFNESHILINKLLLITNNNNNNNNITTPIITTTTTTTTNSTTPLSTTSSNTTTTSSESNSEVSSPQKQQLENSISENRKKNEQLLLEIEKLKEQINNLKKEGEELANGSGNDNEDMGIGVGVGVATNNNNNNNSNSSTTTIGVGF